MFRSTPAPLLAALTLLDTACSSEAPKPVNATLSAAPSASVGAALPVKGRVACGKGYCLTESQLCCDSGDSAHCVPRSDDWMKACNWRDAAYCDDAGDCNQGESCCEEPQHSETEDAWVSSCVAMLPDGTSPCRRTQRCSADDESCRAPFDTCAQHQFCYSSSAPPGDVVCGAAPCQNGLTCFGGEDGPFCAPFDEKAAEEDSFYRRTVIACNRGRDCGPEQACYQNPQSPGRRCDTTIMLLDQFSEPAYCEDDSDCGGFCRADAGTKGRCKHGVCSCYSPCNAKTPCNGCFNHEMFAGAELGEDVCDQASKFCDCRPKPGQKPGN
ncbi:MAG: hypothetical protein U0271_26105 [Polyangiaceae bacterium]